MSRFPGRSGVMAQHQAAIILPGKPGLPIFRLGDRWPGSRSFQLFIRAPACPIIAPEIKASTDLVAHIKAIPYAGQGNPIFSGEQRQIGRDLGLVNPGLAAVHRANGVEIIGGEERFIDCAGCDV